MGSSHKGLKPDLGYSESAIGGSGLSSITLLAIFKNESHVLSEWIDSHAAEGVDKFILVNNNSSDDFESAIGSARYAYRVTLLHDSITHRQSHIYNTAFNSHIQGSDSEWLLVCDLDEFVYARNGFATITDYLRTVPKDVSCIALPWKLYGSSGFDKHPETGVVSNFTYRDDYEPKGDGKIMNGMCSPGWMYSKYIARISQIINLQVHKVTIKSGRLLLPDGNNGTPDSDFQLITEDSLKNYNLHINHYVIQSREFFERVKMTRGAPNDAAQDSIRDWNYFAKHDTNLILDDELARKRQAAVPTGPSPEALGEPAMRARTNPS
jgi:hypothetical protein